MNRKQTVLCLALLALAGNIVAASLGTAFTYQGVATDNGLPATGLYDVQCALYDAPTNGIPIGPLLDFPGSRTDNNGVFTVPLDFGSGVFNGQARWLEFRVRTNGSSGAYTTLLPRQELTPAPSAIWANTAQNLAGNLATTQIVGDFPTARLAGILPSDLLSGTYSSAVTLNNNGNIFSGNGTSLSNVNAATLGGMGAPNFWQLGGNAGTAPGVSFLGTRDNQPLEFRVNNIRGLRIEPNSSGQPNVIGGELRNEVFNGAVGVTIGGGGINTVAASYSTIGGGYLNTINLAANYATIGGGYFNTISTNVNYGTIGGGYRNTISSSANSATISGGYYNNISMNAYYGTIGGGYGSTVTGNYGTIPGGYYNRATNYCFAAGRRARADHAGSFVWADSQNADFASVAGNSFLIRASGGVGINKNNPSAALDVVGASYAIVGTTSGSGYTAVSGNAMNNGSARNYGGSFYALGGSGVGVRGEAAGTLGVGVWGYAPSVATGAATYGGYFQADGLECTGVYSQASAPGGCAVTAYGGTAGYDFYAAGPGQNYGASSSLRWKKDIKLIDEPLAKLTALRGVYFNWDAEHGGSYDVGMIAEEVGKVLPMIVGYEANGMDATGMDYSKMTPLLVEVGKALKTQVDELRQQMADKDVRIGALESDLAELKTLVNRMLERGKGSGK